MAAAMGVSIFMAASLPANGSRARAAEAGSERTTPVVRAPSLRRHDPDQVRRVAASAASQSLGRDSPENRRDPTPVGEAVKRCSAPGDGEAEQFVLRQVPARLEGQGLLVVEICGLLIVQALIGQGAVEIGLFRLLAAQFDALVEVLEPRPE